MIPAGAQQIRDFGHALYGRRYIVPMARAMRTTQKKLRRWSRSGGPDDVPQRIDALLRRRMEHTLRCSAWCARALARTAARSDLDDIAIPRALRLQKVVFDLYPPPKLDSRTVDEILAGDHPMIANFLRPLFEGTEA